MPRGHELKNELREGYVVRNPAMDDFRPVADLILNSVLASFGEPDPTRRPGAGSRIGP
jgi:hypothetical protein